MCGIVGFSGLNDLDLLRKMNEALVHRGPDDRGEFCDKQKQIGLAMRRLSIIDLETGQQPMSNEDETLWVVANGEIYNFAELRSDLLLKGHRFKSHHCDIEVLVHLYEEKGFDMLKELNGMFAFVLYDSKNNIFFGARDRMGIKPFYYTHKNGCFAFASELKALLLLPHVGEDINQQSLYHYMSFQFIPAPATIFEDIKKLPAAHYFVFNIQTKDITVKGYWDCFHQTEKITTVNEAVDLVRKEVERAVCQWSVSDVPIACSLSGGIDSSAIVGLLHRNGIKDLTTFSLGFEERGESFFDERAIARNTAANLGLAHHEIVLKSDDLLNDLEDMVWHLDEPYGGGLPSWYIFKSMKGKVKVALTGTGGDELFGVYGKWSPYEHLGRYLHEFTKYLILDRAPLSTIKAMKRYPQGYFYHRYFSDVMKKKYVFNSNIAGSCLSSEEIIQQAWDLEPDLNSRDKVTAFHFKTQLPEEFLHMTDRFSMAHSIEARTPLLDHKLVEAVMSIPASIRTNTTNMKYLFIEAVKDVLSDEVLQASKKGFILPIDKWLRGPLRGQVEHYLGENYLLKQGIFKKDFFRSIVKPYLNGKYYLKNCVWTAYMFQMWHKRFCSHN
jgi:asparagine synthase (glutamine-hydrolysing)